jgi:hypothetical protein
MLPREQIGEVDMAIRQTPVRRKDEEVAETPKVSCEDIGPNRGHNVGRTIGRGKTKDDAETALYDRLMAIVEREQRVGKVQCSGDCEDGDCYTTFELGGAVTFRRARRANVNHWLCIYTGALRSSCICAV